jgi:hypothetical protein
VNAINAIIIADQVEMPDSTNTIDDNASFESITDSIVVGIFC